MSTFLVSQEIINNSRTQIFATPDEIRPINKSKKRVQRVTDGKQVTKYPQVVATLKFSFLKFFLQNLRSFAENFSHILLSILRNQFENIDSFAKLPQQTRVGYQKKKKLKN